MDSLLENEIKRIKNLKYTKNLTEEEIIKEAKYNLILKRFNIEILFSSSEEQQLASERLKSYLKDYGFEKESDLDTLRSLIYNEVFEMRLQKDLNKFAKPDEKGNTRYPPPQLTEQLTDIQNQKLILKVKLGIDKEDVQDTELSQIQKLDIRAQKYIEEHRNEFELTCGCCGEHLLVWKRTKDFSAFRHPWFVGRWFFNYEILKDVKDGKLSKEDAWRYMTCASQGGKYQSFPNKEYVTDYIDYALEHWAEITSHFEQS